MTRTFLLFALALPGLAPALRGQTSNPPAPEGVAPKGLQVISTLLDPVSRDLTLDLRNVATKTVVAYGLEIKSFDSQGRPVAQVRNEFDYIAPEPNPYRLGFIPPSQAATVSKVSATPHAGQSDLPASANAWRNEMQRNIDRDKQLQAQIASVQVAVLAVVYDDRTFEGDADWIFTVRRRKAALARHILDSDLKAEFPPSREKNRKAMGILRTAGFNPPDEALSKAQWESIRAGVQRDAEWWERQSRPGDPAGAEIHFLSPNR